MKQVIDRILIVGWDGADWRVLAPMLSAGRLPTLQRLIEGGVSGALQSTIPTHSFAAWASLMTGKNPGSHGVYGFGDYDPKQPGRFTQGDRFSIHGETVFQTLSRHGYTVGTAHIPMSFPPAVVNGFWISGMVIPSGAGYTHPVELQGELEQRAGGFFAEDIAWGRLEGRWEDLFDQADAVVQAQGRGLLYLLDRFNCDLLIYVFVSPDRLQHVAWRLIDDQYPAYDVGLAGKYLSRLVGHFELLDRILAQALEQAGENTYLLLISDHGFRPCWLEWSIETFLRQRGFLRMRADWREVRRLLRVPARMLVRNPAKLQAAAEVGARIFNDHVDWGRTQAYVASDLESGLRINLRGRELRGCVEPSAYDRLREQLLDELIALRDPASGRPLAEKVYRREELFRGASAATAPDLVVVPAAGTRVGSSITSRHTLTAHYTWRSGEHGLQGVLVAHGPAVSPGRRLEGARLVDVAPTVLHALGSALPADVDGRPLEALFDRADLGPVRFESPVIGDRRAAPYSGAEEEEAAGHLRGLGYL